MGVFGIMAYWINEVPDHLKTQRVCIEVVEKYPWLLKYVPDHFKTEEMCTKALYDCLRLFGGVPDHLKTRKMCNEAVGGYLWLLEHIPGWFIIRQQIKIWYDDDYWHEDDGIIKWYQGYKKQKAQKAKIKEELLPIAWHPDRVMDCCMPGEEKRLWK